jgi:hypothetical protein
LPTSSIARHSKIFPNWGFEKILYGNRERDLGKSGNPASAFRNKTSRYASRKLAQGEQIGRIFAYICIGRVLSLSSLLKTRKRAKNIGLLFHGNRHTFILTRHGLGHVLGIFFTNSSGHPADRKLLCGLVIN